MRGLRSILGGAALLLAAGGLRAETIPVWPVHWMCAEAEGIVLGERIGANRVRVLEWLMQPEEDVRSAKVIEIVGLDEHSRVVGGLAPAPPGKEQGASKSLRTRRLVCFLERKGVAWYSMSAVGAGSSGLVWIEKGQCYRYQQMENPGPLDLVKETACPTEDALREEIRRGLADRKDWEAALKVANSEEKAVILASYLLPRMSPEGPHRTYQRRVRQVLPKLGRTAVRELIELLRSARAEDELNEAILVLYDLGPEARPAVPHLVPLLKKPKQAHPVRVLEALGRIGDATVAHEIMPLLDHEDVPVRAEAAKSLAQFGYEDAVERIAAAIPAKFEMAEGYYVYAMINAVNGLDPTRGAVLAKQHFDLPAMRHMLPLLRPLVRE